MTARRVAISRVDQGKIEAAVREAVALAGGLEGVVKGDSRVLVKPNVCKQAPSGSGAVTDARVTEAVTRMVLELGPRSVLIGEGASAGYDDGSESTEESMRESGTWEVANRLGVEFRNLNTDAVAEVAVHQPLVMDRLNIARTAVESDVIISIPVLKSHLRTNATVSVKNMMGALPGANKRQNHRVGVDRAIVDLSSVIRPSFAVIDATVAMEGLWRYPQDCRKLGLIMAGRDALAADIAGCWLMEVDPGKVMYLRLLAEREGLSLQPGQIEIAGEALEKHRQRFKTALELFLEGHPGVRVIEGRSACSGCSCELVSAIRHMKNAGFEREMAGLTVVMGNPGEVRAEGKLALIGECAREFAHLGPYAPGCGPTEDAVIAALCDACEVAAGQVMATRDELRRKLWESTESLLQQ